MASPRISEASLGGAVAELLAAEPRFKPVVDQHGLPPLRLVDNSLESLLRIVTEQLISLQAAAAIWQRLHRLLHPFHPDKVSATDIQILRDAGLSTAKARCFIAVAECLGDKRLDLRKLAAADDETARRLLLALPGIGPWTADIYLLTALARPDILPCGDRALQLAAQHLFDLAQAPSAKELATMGEAWKPWRAIAARLLWSHYRSLHGMSQVVQ